MPAPRTALALPTAAVVLALALVSGCSSGGGDTSRDTAASGASSADSTTGTATTGIPATGAAMTPSASGTPAAQASASRTTAVPSASPSPSPSPTWPDLPAELQAWNTEPKGRMAPDAESIHLQSRALIGDMEDMYGSARGAKCWPERPTMWTDMCALGATKANETVQKSLALISHEPAAYFTTLRANAAKITKAVSTYRTNGCAKDPASAKTRQTCQNAAYTIAQAYNSLRDGFNAALNGH
ncbi:hypothetical protein [Streptodolium elevatio]|uniref:Lipoprotein n=1 Tax=Streptodolium elevatio TaxID=3157996 RepID=A0ABV3DEX6_9ACTN